MAFLADVVALVAVDVISWRRTRPLRTGSPPPPLTRDGMARSSGATFLAGTAGLLAMVYGLTDRKGLGWGLLAPTLAGAFVSVTGLAGRVRMLGAGDAGLVVRYVGRPALHVPWAALGELRAPMTPLGGWRLIHEGRRRSLMPSDLLGNEWVLIEAIRAAGLTFEGKRWIKPRPPG